MKTEAVFFLANLFLKQDITSEYVIVDFNCMGLLDLWGARTENYKMIFFAHSEFRTRDLSIVRSLMAQYFRAPV